MSQQGAIAGLARGGATCRAAPMLCGVTCVFAVADNQAMNWGLWAAVVVVLLVGAREIGRDMERRGVGGRHGWRYAIPFLLAPYFMLLVWYIERRRFPVLEDK